MKIISISFGLKSVLVTGDGDAPANGKRWTPIGIVMASSRAWRGYGRHSAQGEARRAARQSAHAGGAGSGS